MSGRELVKARHLERRALVYVRQSSPKQVETNRESADRQYALRRRAEELGWRPEQIETVDEDQGTTQWHSFKDGIAFVLSGLGEAVNQSAVSGSAGLRSLHFLDGRRDRRG